MSDVTQALLIPILKEQINCSGKKIAALNVDYSSELSVALNNAQDVLIYHYDKSKSNLYNPQNFTLINDLSDLDEGFAQIAFLRLPKQRLQAQYLIAASIKSLSEDGQLIIAAGNKEGGTQIQKMCKALGLSFEMYSKYSQFLLQDLFWLYHQLF